MEIHNLITKEIRAVHLKDTLASVFQKFKKYGVDTLPVVDNEEKYLALIRKDKIQDDDDVLVSDVIEKFISGTQEAIREDEHFYEIISKYNELNTSLVPIVDLEGKFLGVVTGRTYMDVFSSSFSFVEPGSMLTLHIPKSDYSMAEIAQIIESEGAAILSSIIHKSDDPTAVNVTLKINLNNLSGVVQSLERHKYKVIARFAERDYKDVLKDRYDELINYLNV